LVAYGETDQRLREAGAEMRLLPGAITPTSALDRIVLRLQHGWAYMRTCAAPFARRSGPIAALFSSSSRSSGRNLA
jgi:hypothetical protein